MHGPRHHTVFEDYRKPDCGICSIFYPLRPPLCSKQHICCFFYERYPNLSVLVKSPFLRYMFIKNVSVIANRIYASVHGSCLAIHIIRMIQALGRFGVTDNPRWPV